MSPRDEIQQLASLRQARVMTFIDGQNLYQSCRRTFGHPLCHPHLLAEHLAGPRAAIECRFYTGRPIPWKGRDEAVKARNLDRRLGVMESLGVTVVTRPLRYHWQWGPAERMPPASADAGERNVVLRPWERPGEKGIDLRIGLEVIEFALTGRLDVAVVVSFDRDLSEIALTLKRLQDLLIRPVRIEAAVPSTKGEMKRLSGFDYTHQITEDDFRLLRDDTDYTVTGEAWKRSRPRPPANLAEARRRRGVTLPEGPA